MDARTRIPRNTLGGLALVGADRVSLDYRGGPHEDEIVPFTIEAMDAMGGRRLRHTPPDVAALRAEEARGYEHIAGLGVEQRSGFHGWLVAPLSLTLRMRTVVIERQVVEDRQEPSPHPAARRPAARAACVATGAWRTIRGAMERHRDEHLSRRSFLKASTAAFYAMAPLGELWRRGQKGLPSRDRDEDSPYGRLAACLDETTGLPLLRLPDGFRYKTYGWTLDLMSDGTPTPSHHDGMGVVTVTEGDVAVLVRNHEIGDPGTAFGSVLYDPAGPGGTTTLWFDLGTEQWVGSLPSLAGTRRNCAGGPTPWGSWLSCEETNVAPSPGGFQATHGWVFEVPGTLPANPVPLTAMGRFAHEAVAVDPATGFVYETEDDRYTSCFYRFRPNTPNTTYGLENGGTLEALEVVGAANADLQQATMGSEYPVAWVPVPDPEAPPRSGVGPFGSFDGETTSAAGPFLQAWERGAARFRRLEGCWYADGFVYFTDTEGGRPTPAGGAPEGTVWRYDPAAETIRVVYESRARDALSHPDNITVSPRGGILLCEDGAHVGQRLHALTRNGRIFPFAENNVVLNGEVNGFVGDYRAREWAGATFDPTGTWLFVNIQSPGITFAITGPWRRGPL